MAKNSLIKSIINVSSTVATTVLIVILISICLNIYITGNSPDNINELGVHINQVYSVDTIKDAFSGFSILIFICLLVVLTGFVFNIVERPNYKILPTSSGNKLRIVKKRIPILPEEAKKEETKRVYIRAASYSVVGVSIIFALRYLLNKDNFTSWDLELTMGNMLVALLPSMIISFAALLAKSIFIDKSYSRELAILATAPKDKMKKETVADNSKSQFYIRIALYVLAVLFIILGVINGGLRDVLVKAINICTECIGLG